MDEKHRSLLKRCRPELVKELHNLDNLCDYLLKHDVFSPGMIEDILAGKTRQAKNRQLLTDITQRGPNAFITFISGLHECDMPHIAEELMQKLNEPHVPGQNRKTGGKSKIKALKREVKGTCKLPNKVDAATDEEIDSLWQSGQLGSHSPTAVINSMWFFATLYFGLRENWEHRTMRWGDVSLCGGKEGRECLEFNQHDTRRIKPKMWDSSNPSRCPVTIYKKYRSLRPVDYCNMGDPFYIHVATNTVDEQLFRRQPMGANKIGSLMKTMYVKANLSSSKKLTNSSARKRLFQKLSCEKMSLSAKIRRLSVPELPTSKSPYFCRPQNRRTV